MRVLLISPLPPPVGGIATWTVKYKQYCEARDIECIIVNNAVRGARREKASAEFSWKDEIIRTARVLYDLLRKLICEKPDVVHLNTSCSRWGVLRDYLCAKIASLASVPVVTQCHCNIQDQLRGKLAVRAFEKLVRISKQVITLNRFSEEYVSHIASRKVVTIPNFTEEDGIYSERQIHESIDKVVFVGHVQPTKGIKEIIKAAEKLPDIRFILIGPVSEEIDALEKKDNVILLGNQSHEQVLQHLKEADVFLFPSYTEGFANALLEAMASGLPVIATDVGANKEMLEEQGGVLIPIKDSNAIVDAIHGLDKERRTAMSEYNTHKVRMCYLRDAVMERIFETYRG